MSSGITDVIIIGNGFDKNLGLKTGYKDFIGSDYFKDLLGKNYFADYLKKKTELERWVDVEVELKKYALELEKSLKNKEEMKKGCILKFKSDYLEVCSSLVSYLKEEVAPNIAQNIDRNSSAYKFLQELVNDSKKFLIFDFNYTKSTWIILRELRNNTQGIIKMHGDLEEGVIFGVQDNSGIPDDCIFLKKSANLVLFKRRELDKMLLGDIKQYHFFGHSMGETDDDYFKSFLSMSNRIDIDISIYYRSEDSLNSMLIGWNRIFNSRLGDATRHFKLKSIKSV